MNYSNISKVNILSLFDGMSCAQLALKSIGIKKYNYYASEIDKYAIKVTQKRFPNTKQIGDITKINTNLLPPIFLLVGGSPCTNFSFAGNRQGMVSKDQVEITSFEQYMEYKNADFKFDGQSYLFWEYIRILKEVKPKCFLLENVKMAKRWESVLTSVVGVEPILINSSLLSAQNRKRLYWTNIPNVKQPKDLNIYLKDIIETGMVTDREKSYCIDASYYKGGNLKQYFQKHRRQLIFQKGHGFNKGGLKALDGKVPTLTSHSWKNNNFVVSLDSHSSKVGLKCVAGIKKNKKWLDDGKILQRNFSQGERIYDVTGKDPTLTANGEGTAGKSVLISKSEIAKDEVFCLTEQRTEEAKKLRKEYREKHGKDFSPRRGKELVVRKDSKSNCITTSLGNEHILGYIHDDIISYRKLTPLECERLQTIPDNYTKVKGVSNSQRYKMVGNGFTVSVIAHILKKMQLPILNVENQIQLTLF